MFHMKLRKGRLVLLVGLLMAVVLVGTELVARYYLGLGDPPLTIRDPQIEYLFKPDQDVRRFGNHIRFNHFSMRSDDFPPHKTDPRELRVLFLGDSIINGGAVTDQAQLATELIRARLAADLDRPVVVGNVSAGSWGPPNQLAYLKRFGIFDADIVVFVVSSHDYADVPQFPDDLGTDFPLIRPPLALWEAVSRYLPRYLPSSASPPPPTTQVTPAESDVQQALNAFDEMIELATSKGAAVLVAQHLERDEPRDAETEGHLRLRMHAERHNVPVLQLGSALTVGMYRDAIHPDAHGQQAIADAIYPALRSAAGSR